MPADKYLFNNAGAVTEREALQTSAGAGDAGKIPALDGTGRLDSSMMPVGIGADTAIINATEDLAAGDLVNIYDDSGAFACRKADASAAGKEAHGFVLAAVTGGNAATVYFEGTDTQLTSLAPGVQFLSATTPGRTSSTAPNGTGKVVQRVGIAVGMTALNFEAGMPIVLA